jgi:hypothetical protein
MSEKIFVIPPDRTRYLSEISENNRSYDKWVNQQVAVAEKLHGLQTSIQTISNSTIEDKDYYFKYFWLVYTWNSVMLDAADKLGYNSQLKEIVQPIKPDLDTTKRFKEIIKNESKLIDIEKDLTNLDQFLKNKKVKLIFEQIKN